MSLGGELRGKGGSRGEGLCERLQGKLYEPQMPKGKWQSQNHQDACQKYRSPGPAQTH